MYSVEENNINITIYKMMFQTVLEEKNSHEIGLSGKLEPGPAGWPSQ